MKSDLCALRGSPLRRASYHHGVGFSNFVLRARGIAVASSFVHAATLIPASRVYRDLAGRYYAGVLMDVKSEATPPPCRRRWRERRRCSFCRESHDSRSEARFANSCYLFVKCHFRTEIDVTLQKVTNHSSSREFLPMRRDDSRQRFPSLLCARKHKTLFPSLCINVANL